MNLKANPSGVAHAKQLIDEGKWALNTQWSANQPSLEAQQNYLTRHGEEALSQWFLAVDTAANGGSTYQFPIGDFRKVHRSGVVAARRYAEQNQLGDLVEAADEILDLFDRINAC
jgi:hypothetical protein